MSTPIEDRVRDLLADRTAAVAPPVDWEERVVSAGRRRRARRRVSVGAAVAVVLVMLAAVASQPPSAVRGIEPVSPTETGGPAIDPGDLPEGAETPHLYATGQADGAVTVVSEGRSWAPQARVGTLLDAGDGIVAMLSWDSEQLVYRGANGEVKTLQASVPISGVAVSADGKQVAWMNSEFSDTRLGTLKLAELPSGKVISSLPVDQSAPPRKGTPTVEAFVGDRVVLGYEDFTSPYAWSPGAKRIEPLFGSADEVPNSKLLDVHGNDTVLVMDRKGCVRDLGLAPGGPVERWKACGFDPDYPPEVRISPDGRWFAGLQPEGDTVWVRDLRTGQLIWQQRFKQGIDLGDSFSDRRIVSGLRLSRLEWESPDALLVTYGSPRDLDGEVADLMRCATDAPRCERVPTKAGERVTSLGR